MKREEKASKMAQPPEALGANLYQSSKPEFSLQKPHSKKRDSAPSGYRGPLHMNHSICASLKLYKINKHNFQNASLRKESHSLQKTYSTMTVKEKRYRENLHRSPSPCCTQPNDSAQ